VIFLLLSKTNKKKNNMTKYYIDTEFLQEPQKKKMFGINYGQTKPLVDLISIGIVGEDNREYYAISKEFNLEEAWNRFGWEPMNTDIPKAKSRRSGMSGFISEEALSFKKVYWIRENVLRPIWEELSFRYIEDRRFPDDNSMFTCKSLKNLLNKYGKTNKQIAEEIKEFVGTEETIGNWEQVKDRMNTQFYAYYGAFDYVAFSQIFGGFEGYPKSFPQYFIDLKQELDNKADVIRKSTNLDTKQMVETIEGVAHYPKEPTTHHALSDAHWNKQLHEFLNTL
jgi:hypothetical protein